LFCQLENERDRLEEELEEKSEERSQLLSEMDYLKTSIARLDEVLPEIILSFTD